MKLLVKLADNNCTPLRRHSVSAPPSLALRILETCQQRVSDLSVQVDVLSKVCREEDQAGSHSLSVPVVARSKSLSDLSAQLPVVIMDSGLAENMVEGDSKVPKTEKPRRCHQCHTPVEEMVHAGIRPGVGVCKPLTGMSVMGTFLRVMKPKESLGHPVLVVECPAAVKKVTQTNHRTCCDR